MDWDKYVEELQKLQLWDLRIYCGGLMQAEICGVDVDTINFMTLLQEIDAKVVSRLKVEGPIQYDVKYSDPVAWGEYKDITSDLDMMDMFIAHRHRDVISLHLTYKPAIPCMCHPVKPTQDEVQEVFLLPPTKEPNDVSDNPEPTPQTVSETPLPPHVDNENTPPSPHSGSEIPQPPLHTSPQIVENATASPIPAETPSQSTGTQPPNTETQPSSHSMYVTPTDKHNKWNDLKKQARAALSNTIKFSGKRVPPMQLVDEPSSEDDSPTDSSDEDGVHPPPAVELDEETRRRRDAEVQEYYKDVDDVLNLSDEEEEWRTQGHESDDEDYAGLVDEELVPDYDEMSDHNSEDNLHQPISDSELEDGCTNVYKAFSGKSPKLDNDGKVVLETQQVYNSGKHLRDTLRDYCVENGFEFKRLTNEPTRITWKCKVEDCPWRVHASTLQDGKSFKIKTLNDMHTCSRKNVNVEANSTWMARRLIECFREDPNMSTAGVKAKLKVEFGLEVDSKKQLYRARCRAIEELEGSHRQSYEQLSAYRDELMRTNPGSKFVVEYCNKDGGVPKFKRLFMAVAGLKDGFINGCRPLIGMDGCHLKGPYKGTLLSAVSLDGNNGVYPICWAVVEGENKATWRFFCENLSDVLDADLYDTDWCFMTDGQKGLVDVVQEFFPGAEHRRCAWHLFNNFRGKHQGVLLAKMFWKASRAYTEQEYKHALNVIKETSLEAYIWLIKIPANYWSRHAFGKGTKSDHVTNNHTESFNGWLGDLREKPIVKLVDGIRQKVMVRVHKRYLLSEKWDGVLTDNIRKKLVKIVESGRKCTVNTASKEEFEVLDAKMMTFTVDLEERSCSCGKWEITGIPCKHVATCIAYCRKQVVDYVDRCYYKDTFQKANGQYIVHPIHDPAFWGPGTGQPPAPPANKRGRGRPKNVRMRDHTFEPAASGTGQRNSGIVQCSVCKGWGHNARTCGRVPYNFMSPQEKEMYAASQTSKKKRNQSGEGSSSKGKGKNVTQPTASTQETQPTPASDSGNKKRKSTAGSANTQPTASTQETQPTPASDSGNKKRKSTAGSANTQPTSRVTRSKSGGVGHGSSQP